MSNKEKLQQLADEAKAFSKEVFDTFLVYGRAVVDNKNKVVGYSVEDVEQKVKDKTNE
jgi:hypothetical protein